MPEKALLKTSGCASCSTLYIPSDEASISTIIMKTDEIIKRLDIIIEQNNNIIKQDYFRAKHIATIKKDNINYYVQ